MRDYTRMFAFGQHGVVIINVRLLDKSGVPTGSGVKLLTRGVSLKLWESFFFLLKTSINKLSKVFKWMHKKNLTFNSVKNLA